MLKYNKYGQSHEWCRVTIWQEETSFILTSTFSSFRWNRYLIPNSKVNLLERGVNLTEAGFSVLDLMLESVTYAAG